MSARYPLASAAVVQVSAGFTLFLRASTLATSGSSSGPCGTLGQRRASRAASMTRGSVSLPIPASAFSIWPRSFTDARMRTARSKALLRALQRGQWCTAKTALSAASSPPARAARRSTLTAAGPAPSSSSVAWALALASERSNTALQSTSSEGPAGAAAAGGAASGSRGGRSAGGRRGAAERQRERVKRGRWVVFIGRASSRAAPR